MTSGHIRRTKRECCPTTTKHLDAFFASAVPDYPFIQLLPQLSGWLNQIAINFTVQPPNIERCSTTCFAGATSHHVTVINRWHIRSWHWIFRCVSNRSLTLFGRHCSTRRHRSESREISPGRHVVTWKAVESMAFFPAFPMNDTCPRLWYGPEGIPRIGV